MLPRALPIVLALGLGACATSPDPLRPRAHAPLALRQAQSRTFEAVEAKVVLKAVLNVLQDEGFVIKEANVELGLVTAVMERAKGKGSNLLKWVVTVSTYGAGAFLPWGADVTSIEACVNVSPEGSGSRVRLSLVSRRLDRKGSLQGVEPVTDAAAYQRLLAGLDKGIYLQKEGL